MISKIIIFDEGFKITEKHIAFSVNQERVDTSDFSRMILSTLWPEFYKDRNHPLCIGDVVSKTLPTGQTLHALVTHSFDKQNWKKNNICTKELIQYCFNKIHSNMPIGTILIGNSFIESLIINTAPAEIVKGMYQSDKNISLYLPKGVRF